jgi:hypothetical protein
MAAVVLKADGSLNVPGTRSVCAFTDREETECPYAPRPWPHLIAVGAEVPDEIVVCHEGASSVGSQHPRDETRVICEPSPHHRREVGTESRDAVDASWTMVVSEGGTR